MRALVTGAGGQVGRELKRRAPTETKLTALCRDQLDISDANAVLECANQLSPQLIVNSAAYTAVDRAESDREAAFAVNATGARNVAVAARQISARLIHLSTDYVFDGAQDRPYRPDDPTHPLSAYGRSKLDGEEAVESVCPGSAVIVRTSLVYSEFGNNFLKTMLSLMKERSKLGVVDDQVSSPTWAGGLADAVWELGSRPDVTGVIHWTDAGAASRFELALEIQRIAFELGLLDSKIPIEPISTDAFPTPAARPPFSVLDTTEARKLLATTQLHWKEALRLMLESIAGEGNE